MMKKSLSVVVASSFAGHGVALGQGLECDYGLTSDRIVSTTGYPSDFTSFGDYLYLEVDISGLLIDMRDPDDISLLWPWDLLLRDPPVHAQGYLYFEHENDELGIIDIDMLNFNDYFVVDESIMYEGVEPHPLGSSGRVLYVKNRATGDLLVFDLDDPRSPTPTGYELAGFEEAERMHVLSSGTRAVVLDDGRARVLDLTDPFAPVVLSSVQFPAELRAEIDEAVFIQDRLYALGETRTLHMFEIAADNELTETDEYQLSTEIDPESIITTEGRLWVRSRYGSFAFSVHPDTGAPAQITFIPEQIEFTRHGKAVEVELYDDPFSGIPETRVDVHSVDGLSRSPLLWDGGDSAVVDVALSEDYLLTLAPGGVLSVHELNGAAPPVWISSVPVGTSARDIIHVDGDLVYLHHWLPHRLSIVDLADPTKPSVLLNQWLIPEGDRIAVAIDGSIAFVNADDSLAAYDLSDPTSPTFLGRAALDPAPAGSHGRPMAIEDGYIFVARYNEIYIFDIADVGNMQYAGHFLLRDGYASVVDLHVRGPAVYISYDDDFYPNASLYDVTNPAVPVFVSNLPRSDSPAEFSSRGDMMLVANREWYPPEGYYPVYGCYALYDVSDPLDPQFQSESYAFGTHFAGAVLLDDVALLQAETPILMRYDDPCTTCDSDIDQDRLISADDIALMIQLFLAGDPLADLNGDGRVNFYDLAQYINTFGAGCG